MRYYILIIFLTIHVMSMSQVATIALTNSLPLERSDELIILPRSFLIKKLKKTKGSALSNENYVTVTENKRPLVVQYDDINGDGIWDEAVFLTHFQPGETKKLNIAVSQHPATVKSVVRACVRQKHLLADGNFGNSILKDTMPYNNPPTDFSKQKLPPYLTEGPAWENDRVGFRKYFDIRNANDIWGKRVPQMVLNEVGAHPKNNYHKLSDWGMDVLKVGNSLGAGALALLVKRKNRGDSLIRFGRNVKQTIYEEIANGPVRAVFRITYQNWQYLPQEKPITVSEQISIWGGQNFFENTVVFEKVPRRAHLVTGTIDFYSKEAVPVRENGVAGLFTHDRQSENKDVLGLSILTKSKNFSGTGHITSSNSDVTNSFIVKMKPRAKQPLSYRYYVGWELTEPAFSNREGFEKMINQSARELSAPIVIR